MNLISKQKEMHRKLKIVYLINKCDARLETIHNWIRCHNSDFFHIQTFYRDTIINTKQRRKYLKMAYMESEGVLV